MRKLIAFTAAAALAGLPQLAAAEKGKDAQTTTQIQGASGTPMSQQEIERTIQEDLTQAGLSEEVAREHAEGLASDVTDMQETFKQSLEQVRRGYADALAKGDISREEAQKKADELVQDLAQVELPDSVSASSDTMQIPKSGAEVAQMSSKPEQLSESDKRNIRSQLKKVGVEDPRIAELERNAFSQAEVEQAVRQAKIDAGESEDQARQEARRVALTVDEVKTGAAAPADVAAAGATDEAKLSTTDHAMLSQRLKDAGVDSAQVKNLQQAGFPKDRTTQAIEEAHVKRGEEEAQSVASLIDQLKQEKPEGATP